MKRMLAADLHVLRVLFVVPLLLVVLQGRPTDTRAKDPPPPSTFEHYEHDYFREAPGNTASHRQSSFPQNGDTDGDGLADTDETSLGTDPNNVDSDCDHVDDGTEVVNAANPTDSDSDDIIDALESKLVDSDQDGTVDQTDPTSGVQVSCGYFTPFAIQNDDTDSTRLEVRITGGTNVTTVTVEPAQYSSSYLNLEGTPVDGGAGIQLFDDGTHGDRVSGDSIWTRGQFTFHPTWFTGRWALSFYVVNVTDNGTPTAIDRRDVIGRSFSEMALGLVDEDDVQTPIPVSAQVQLVSHLANVVDPLGSLALKRSYNEGLRSTAQLFYQEFDDDYDFLLFFPDSPVPKAPYGFFVNVRNDVQHIGVGQFDNTANYGSAGKLQGTLFLNFNDNGPTIHEVMHNWAAHGLTSLGFGQCTDSVHWGVSGVGKGQLGGFDPATLVDNGDGTYTVGSFGPNANGGDTVDYAPLERYLAGLVDASGVPPIPILEDVDCVNVDYDPVSQTLTFTATGIYTVTIDDVMTTLGGSRDPGFADSQKDFTGGFTVVSQRPLNGPEMAFFNGWAKLFGAEAGSGFLKSFQEASAGVATMDTQMLKTTTNDVDTWIRTLSPVSVLPGGVASIPISYGNMGGTTATSVVVTATLGVSLTYQSDTSGVVPTVTENPITTTVVWNLPDLGVFAQDEFALQVGTPGAASLTGNRHHYTLTIGSSGPEALPGDNAVDGQVVIIRAVYLPLVRR